MPLICFPSARPVRLDMIFGKLTQCLLRSVSAASFKAFRLAAVRLRFLSSDGFSYLCLFFTSEKIPDFLQDIDQRLRAFSNGSPGFIITPLTLLLCHLFSFFCDLKVSRA